MKQRNPDRILLYAAPLLIAALCIAAVDAMLGSPRAGIDDANITFTYARNFARGNGFVFTPGFERVEGFTSALWTLICAAAFKLTAPEKWILAVSAALTALSVLAVWATVEALVRDRDVGRGGRILGRVLAALWLLGVPDFYGWSAITLMDVGLWATEISFLGLLLVLAASSAALATLSLALAVVASAMILTRPEAMLLAPVAIALFAIVVFARTTSASAALRAGALPILLSGATLVALTIFRLAYFGYPLPNTYYAKVSPDRLYNLTRGAEYLGQFLAAYPVATAAACVSVAYLVLALAAAAKRGVSRPLEASIAAPVAVVALIAVGFLLPLVGGGDHFRGFRFLQPFVPLMIVPVVGALVVAGRARPPSRRMVEVVGVAFCAAVALFGAWRWRDYRAHNGILSAFLLAQEGRRMGAALNRTFAAGPKPVVAAVIAGGLGFTYEGRLLDLVGLNWTAMGHSPGERKGIKNHAAFNEDVFYAALPDLVTPQFLASPPLSACDVFIPLDQHAMHYIYTQPRFRGLYSGGYVDAPGRAVGAFFLNAWLSRTKPSRIVPFAGAAAACDLEPSALKHFSLETSGAE